MILGDAVFRGVYSCCDRHRPNRKMGAVSARCCGRVDATYGRLSSRQVASATQAAVTDLPDRQPQVSRVANVVVGLRRLCQSAHYCRSCHTHFAPCHAPQTWLTAGAQRAVAISGVAGSVLGGLVGPLGSVVFYKGWRPFRPLLQTQSQIWRFFLKLLLSSPFNNLPPLSEYGACPAEDEFPDLHGSLKSPAE